jgi:hypothetical protein
MLVVMANAMQSESTHRPNRAKRFIRQPSSRRLITYSKKDSKLLPLNAKQFRTSVYDIPDDDSDGDSSEGNIAVGSRCPKNAKNSPNSVNVAGGLRTTNGQANEHPNERFHGHKINLLSVPSANDYHNSTGTGFERVPEDDNSPQPLVRKHKATAKVKPKPRQSSTSAATAKPTIGRCLPVNELFLVQSPVDYTHFDSPPTSPPDIAAQDPISEHAGSPCKRAASPSSWEGVKAVKRGSKAPLSVLRLRLKPPPPLFKAIKRTANAETLPRGGDGFEDNERRVSHAKLRRQRRTTNATLQAFGSLTLSSGPLPEVEFDESGVELKVKTVRQDEVELGVADEHDGAPSPTTRPSSFSSCSSSRRRVSFNDSAREKAILSQLASIKAPAREPNVSDDSNDEFEGDEPDVEEDDEDHEEHEAEETEEDEGHPSASSECAQDAATAEEQRIARPVADKPIDDKRKQGVMLDFRNKLAQAHGIGSYSSKQTQRRRLIEVDESIEVPNSSVLVRPVEHISWNELAGDRILQSSALAKADGEYFSLVAC